MRFVMKSMSYERCGWKLVEGDTKQLIGDGGEQKARRRENLNDFVERGLCDIR